MPALAIEDGYAALSKLDKDALLGRLNIVATAALLERLEEWRAAQRPIPTKSEAARILIERALEAEGKAKGGRQ